MNEDADLLPDRERARVRSRDRKVRGPRVIADNPGLRQLALHLAERRRSARLKPVRAARPKRRRRR